MLVAVTALIVARPLVLGEDPGLVDPLSDPGGLLLSFLWLIAALLWGVWRIWSGDGSWRGGLAELGLLAVVGFQLLAAGFAAHYHHPAWLIASEWLIFLVAFVLVRQLSTTARDRQFLLAAVLATAVCVCGQALFLQAAFHVPELQARYLNRPEKLRQDLAKQGESLEEGDPRLEKYLQRIREGHLSATFAHPNSFAGYLALLLPVVAGFTVVAWRQRRESWQIGLLALCTALLVLSLWLTHSRGALLATAVAGGAAAAWAALRGRQGDKETGRQGDRETRRRSILSLSPGLLVSLSVCLLAGLAGVILWGGWLDTATGKGTGALAQRLDYWRATWALIVDQPWLGVGPGNFDRHYPQYMRPAAFEYLRDPHNFLLELWATTGVFGLLALVVCLGSLLARTVGFTAVAQQAEPSTPPQTTPWEYYLGGMGGLLLAFLIRGMGLTPEALGDEAAAALLRAIAWFAAFALFGSVAWSGPSMVLALTAGVSALLLNLLVSGGISFPAVAQPLWIMAALALAGTEPALPDPGTQEGPATLSLLALWPLPVALALTLGHFLLIFTPVIRCATHRTQLRKAENDFLVTRQTKGPAAALPKWAKVRIPLGAALEADPADVAPLHDWASWCLESGEYFHELKQENVNPDYRGARYADAALTKLAIGRKLDPFGKDVLFRALQVHLAFAHTFEENREDRLEAAEILIGEIGGLDPREVARLHYRLADACFALKNAEKGKAHASQALEHDQQGSSAAHKLTDRQRRQVRQWLGLPADG